MKLKPFLVAFTLMLAVYGISFSQEKTAEFYYNRGRENFENCAYHHAMEDYNMALQIKPDYVEALNGRGEIYLNVGEYANAENEFNAAIMLSPKYEKAYINRGRMYKKLGYYERAINDWTKAVELNPNLDELKEELSDLYLCQGSDKSEIKDIKGAIKDLILSCAYNPGNAESWYRLGVMFLYIGDFTNADKCFFIVRTLFEKTEENKNIDTFA